MNDLDNIKDAAKTARTNADNYELRLLASAVLGLIAHIERNSLLANVEIKERVGS